jgi:hypothetical protein
MKRIYIFLLSIILFSSCQQVLDVDLNSTDPKIVIEGLITDTLGPFTVKVTTSADYYNTELPPAVTNATVIVKDVTSGITDTLAQTAPGIYQTHNSKIPKGITNHTYTLDVQLNGLTYSATSTLPSLSRIDSLNYLYYPQKVFGHQKGYYPRAYQQEPQNENNYYLWKFFRNDSLINKPNEIWVADDQFVQGNVNGLEFPYVYQSKDTATVEFYSLTKESYDFYLGLQAQLQNDGGFFSAPPANARGNFSNGALGIFQTSGLDTKKIIIP